MKNIPELDKPGAGLPFIQRYYMLIYLGPIASKYSNWNKDSARFNDISAKIMKLVMPLTESQIQTRVLIRPQVGLEDSSRYWSVAMTLEHILFTSSQMQQIIIALSRNLTPPVTVDVAKLKPKGDKTGTQIFKNFETFSQEVIQNINSAILDRQAVATVFHPWFGAMNAHQWHWLMGYLLLIHYRQILEIIKEL